MFFPLTDPLVASFNETRAPTSRKYVVEEGIVIPNWSKKFRTFWSHSSVFALEKPTNLNFQSVFPSNRLFGGYFQWNPCTYFQKMCSWTRYSDPNWSKAFQTFWSHCSVFSLEKQPKNLNFDSFCISNRPFDGYFQWKNPCTYFQKICSWAGYSNAKLIKNISNFLVALLRICFRKTT